MSRATLRPRMRPRRDSARSAGAQHLPREAAHRAGLERARPAQAPPGRSNQDLPVLLADYYNSRAQLISALFGRADDQLDAKPGDGGWTIRETIEHVLYWDRDSIDTLKAEV